MEASHRDSDHIDQVKRRRGVGHRVARRERELTEQRVCRAAPEEGARSIRGDGCR